MEKTAIKSTVYYKKEDLLITVSILTTVFEIKAMNCSSNITYVNTYGINDMLDCNELAEFVTSGKAKVIMEAADLIKLKCGFNVFSLHPTGDDMKLLKEEMRLLREQVRKLEQQVTTLKKQTEKSTHSFFEGIDEQQMREYEKAPALKPLEVAIDEQLMGEYEKALKIAQETPLPDEDY